MTDQALDILKLVLLGLLYLFFARVLWAVWSEVRSANSRATAPHDAARTSSTTAAATVAAPVPTTRRQRRRERPGQGPRRAASPASWSSSPRSAAAPTFPLGRRDHGRSRSVEHDHDRRRHVRVEHPPAHLRRRRPGDGRGPRLDERLVPQRQPPDRHPPAAPRRPHPGRLHGPGGAVVAELRWGAATDPGRIRPDNEDNFLAEPNVFVVADGMGGHRAGEVASALAVDLLRTPAERARRRPRAGGGGDRRRQQRHLSSRHRQPRAAGDGHDRDRAGGDRGRDRCDGRAGA